MTGRLPDAIKRAAITASSSLQGAAALAAATANAYQGQIAFWYGTGTCMA